MFRELLAISDTARHAWLARMPKHGRTSDFLNVWNSAVVWCNNTFATAGNLSSKIRHIADLYWMTYCLFSHSFRTLVINHSLFRRDSEKWISDNYWTWLEYNLGGLNVGKLAQASQQRLGRKLDERLHYSVYKC